MRCVAWLCRCVLDLVAANAAHLLCPWWMSLSGAVQRVGWPAACERQAADRQTRTGSQGWYLLCREVLRSCPPAASCPPHAHGPHGPRASAPQRDAPGQSRAPGPRLSNQECHWSHAGQAQTTKGTVGGVTCGTVFNFHALGVSGLPVDGCDAVAPSGHFLGSLWHKVFQTPVTEPCQPVRAYWQAEESP